MSVDTRDRIRGSLLGLACGDAVGTTVEFRPRGSFAPVRDMSGGGPFRLAPGQWTDDTSMALCLASSLVERGCFDADDQMRRYVRWWREGYLSATGRCFDIGTTVSTALSRYERTGEPYSGPTDERSAGNGCIMRLAPVPLFYYPSRESVLRYSAESSRTTHGATECVEACRLLAGVLFRALRGDSKRDVLTGSAQERLSSRGLSSVASGEYRDKPESAIEGSGYVVRCLEAALWSFDGTDSFEAAVLGATNLGDDADTTAAVCGQVAGAFYGRAGIPERWLARLAMRDEIERLADGLHDAAPIDVVA